MVSALHLDRVGKSFGQFRALDDVSLDLKQGEFLTMLGPSGSGKTTTLRLVAGFMQPDTGRVAMAGRDLTGVPAHKRNIGMVFQDYALFPHMTVTDNVSFPLEARGVPKAERRRRALEMLEIVNLTPYVSRYPRELSGGQQQRVALARALVFDPAVVLLDEPLGALDKKLRTTMQLEILRITRRFGATVISVTHDQEEALIMSDRIALFRHGGLAQVGSPVDLYSRPNSAFVADFIGESNLLAGELVRDGGAIRVRGDVWHAAVDHDRVPAGATGKVTLMIRPERLHLVTDGAERQAGNVLDLTIRETVYLGSGLRVQGTVGAGAPVQVAVPDDALIDRLRPGTSVQVSWMPKDGVVLLN